MARTIRVPDVLHPKFCYKQKLAKFEPGADNRGVMSRCIFKKGHPGRHSWDIKGELGGSVGGGLYFDNETREFMRITARQLGRLRRSMSEAMGLSDAPVLATLDNAISILLGIVTERRIVQAKPGPLPRKRKAKR